VSTGGDPLEGVNAETVHALLTAVQWFEDAEERRGESLNGRASGVSGLVALIISVSAALAHLQTDSVHDRARTAALVLFFGAALAFLSAMWMAIFKVLRPKPAFVVHEEEVLKYPNYEWIRKRPAEVHGYLIKASASLLKTERDKNNGKATWLNRAYAALLVGVLCLAGDGLILFHTNGRPERNTPRPTARAGAASSRITIRQPGAGSSRARARPLEHRAQA